jgi:FKBP-type peptidyl-prolyl cis-trans isomerase FkpA
MRILILTLVTSFFVVSCSKDNGCKSVPPEEEKAQLEAYNTAHGINATAHYSGLYYEILDTGATLKPTRASTVFVKYTGKKFDGTVFDAQSNPGATGFSLSNLIEGWKVGIPMIGKGGHILLTVPSSMAYGCVGSSGSSDTTKNIAPNTPLFFDIELVDFY